MRKFIDCEATIQDFFNKAVAWLEGRPVHLRDGQNKEKIAADYMKLVRSDSRKYTANHAVYSNCGKLEGFIEQGCDKTGRLFVVNNDLYFAVIKTLDAIDEYYQNNNQVALLKSIKQFEIALNRKNVIKSIAYKLRAPYYFAQKQK